MRLIRVCAFFRLIIARQIKKFISTINDHRSLDRARCHRRLCQWSFRFNSRCFSHRWQTINMVAIYPWIRSLPLSLPYVSLSLSLSWLPSISRFILNVNRKGHIFPSLRRPAAWLIATDVHIIIVMHVSEVWADHWNRCTVTSYGPIEIKTQKLYKSKEKKKQCPHRRHRRRWIASKPDPTDRRGQTERCNLVTEM